MCIMRSSINAPKEADVMRGTDVHQSGLFSYVSLESRVPQEHPLRGIKELLDETPAGMSCDAADFILDPARTGTQSGKRR